MIFQTDFLLPNESDEIFRKLLKEVAFESFTNTFDGITELEPKQIAWYGEYPYTYGAITHQPKTNWPPTILSIKHKVERHINCELNSVLCNLYRDKHDHVSWHTDGEPELGNQPTIASVSLGETRKFVLRKIQSTEGQEVTHGEMYTFPLNSGSLLVMKGATQQDWEHCIMTEDRDCTARINLTFRRILPPK